jgi:hypothetical protein
VRCGKLDLETLISRYLQLVLDVGAEVGRKREYWIGLTSGLTED